MGMAMDGGNVDGDDMDLEDFEDVDDGEYHAPQEHQHVGDNPFALNIVPAGGNGNAQFDPSAAPTPSIEASDSKSSDSANPQQQFGNLGLNMGELMADSTFANMSPFARPGGGAAAAILANVRNNVTNNRVQTPAANANAAIVNNLIS